MPRIRVATYNIHCGIGRDGRFSERRVLDVLRELDADVVAMQERVGIGAVTDGEFRRTWWHLDFLERFQNATVGPPSVKAKFHRAEGDIEVMPPGIRGTCKVAAPSASKP